MHVCCGNGCWSIVILFILKLLELGIMSLAKYALSDWDTLNNATFLKLGKVVYHIILMH